MYLCRVNEQNVEVVFCGCEIQICEVFGKTCMENSIVAKEGRYRVISGSCNNNETHQCPHARSQSIILSDELASSTLYVLIAFTRIPDRKKTRAIWGAGRHIE